MLVLNEYSVCRSVLKSETFGVFPISDRYRELERRFGHDFRAVIALLERLPPFLDGEAHKASRRTLATFQAKGHQLQLKAAERWFAHFGKAVLQPGCRIDLLTDFACPLFRAIGEAYARAMHLPEEATNLAEDIPLLFSSYTPLGRRLELNQALGLMESAGGEMIYDHLALLALGVRPLTGSLALSLHHVFAEQPTMMLSAMRWPATFPVSALHFIDRIALAPVEISGRLVAQGERVRCLTFAEEWSDEERRANLFGGGAHLCLGQSLSRQLWEMAVAFFSRHDLLAEVLALHVTPKHEPFNMPDACQVVFSRASR